MDQNIFQVIEFIAVVTAAVYGILQARSASMDALGVFTLAFVVAFGGGTLRDLFLDRHPLFWIGNPHYPMIVLGMTIVTCLIPHMPTGFRKYLDIPDAVGLGLFTVVGAQFSLEAGTGMFVASLLAVITGTFGGVISDVLCNRVPSLFRSSPLYATCSFIGSWVFLALHYGNAPEIVAAVCGIITTVLLRFAALYWSITLPELHDAPAEANDVD